MKGEKNLKFLLQKVLKQSDVGSLGRIVLPKVIKPLNFLTLNLLLVYGRTHICIYARLLCMEQKEAEMHLPELDARDGISIAMEDIGTSQVWNMRYRYMQSLSFHQSNNNPIELASFH